MMTPLSSNKLIQKQLKITNKNYDKSKLAAYKDISNHKISKHFSFIAVLQICDVIFKWHF